MATFKQLSYPKILTFIYGSCNEDCINYDITQHASAFNAVYDFTESGFSRWYKPNGASYFTELECGHIYLAIINPGDLEFEIPNTEIVYFENNEASLRFTNNCSSILPTPTPACPAKVTWEVLTSGGTWELQEIDADEVLTKVGENKYCTTDYIVAVCADNNYATNRGWFDNNFSDVRNIKYIDCDGNEYEPKSIQYKVEPVNCGNIDTSNASGILIDFCVEVDCSKLSYEIKTNNGTWIYKEISGKSNLILDEETNLLCSNHWKSGICIDSETATELDLENGNYQNIIRNFKYTDCNGTEYETSTIEYRLVDGLCGDNADGKIIEFRVCIDVSTPTPTPSDNNVVTPTPTPTPTPLSGTLGTPRPTANTPTSSQILTWSWLPITNATSYGIWVDDFNGNPDKVIEATGSESVFSYTHQVLLEDGDHTIRVIAMDADGNMSNPGTHMVTINTSLPTNNLGLQWVVKPDDVVVENTSETWTWITNYQNVKYNYKLFVAGSSVTIAEANNTSDTTLTTTIPNGENDYVMAVTMIKSDNTVETLIHRFTTLIAQIKYTYRIPTKAEFTAKTGLSRESVDIYPNIKDFGTGTTIDYGEDDVQFFKSIPNLNGPSTATSVALGEESYTIEIVARGNVRSFWHWHIGGSGYNSNFQRCAWLLQSVEVVGMNSIWDAGHMFYGCENLTSVDVSKWNSSNLMQCDVMFEECRSIVNLDLSALNTSNVSTMYRMFKSCTSLTNLNIVPNATNGTWNTPKVKNMSEMFNNCSALEYVLPENYSTTSGFVTLDRTNAEIVFDISAVTGMTSMFQNCSSLKNLYATNWSTGNVDSMQSMFEGCSSMNFLDCGNWSTGTVTLMTNMFRGCGEMNDASVDFSSWCVSRFVNGEPSNFRAGTDITEAPAWGQSC